MISTEMGGFLNRLSYDSALPQGSVNKNNQKMLNFRLSAMGFKGSRIQRVKDEENPFIWKIHRYAFSGCEVSGFQLLK